MLWKGICENREENMRPPIHEKPWKMRRNTAGSGGRKLRHVSWDFISQVVLSLEFKPGGSLHPGSFPICGYYVSLSQGSISYRAKEKIPCFITKAQIDRHCQQKQEADSECLSSLLGHAFRLNLLQILVFSLKGL